MIRRPPRSTLFPYPTLSRSRAAGRPHPRAAHGRPPARRSAVSLAAVASWVDPCGLVQRPLVGCGRPVRIDGQPDRMGRLAVETVKTPPRPTDRAPEVLRPWERLTLRIGRHPDEDRNLVANQLGDVLGLPCEVPAHQPIRRQLG